MTPKFELYLPFRRISPPFRPLLLNAACEEHQIFLFTTCFCSVEHCKAIYRHVCLASELNGQTPLNTPVVSAVLCMLADCFIITKKV